MSWHWFWADAHSRSNAHKHVHERACAFLMMMMMMCNWDYMNIEHKMLPDFSKSGLSQHYSDDSQWSAQNIWLLN